MEYQSRTSRAMAWKFVSAHLRRMPARSALTMVIAVVFTLTMGFIGMLITGTGQEVDRLYEMTEIDAELELADSMALPTDDYIRKETVNDLQRSGFFRNTNAQLAAGQALWAEEEKVFDFLIMRGIAEDQPLPFIWKDTAFSYAEGWDASCFAGDWSGWDRPLPVFANEALLAETGLQLGEEVLLTEAGIEWEDTLPPKCKPTLSVIITGAYTMQERIPPSGDLTATMLFPLSGINRFDDIKGYAAAEFVIKPDYNRKLNELNESIKETVNRNHGNVPLRLLIWDEEIRSVVEPMERTLSLLAVLYPVTTAAAVGIAAALAYLMVLQNAANAAILRVLGMDRRRALWVQMMEQWIPCAAGLGLGLTACLALPGNTGAESIPLLRAGLYFMGCTAGSLIAGISTTGRAPLNLLQVKE